MCLAPFTCTRIFGRKVSHDSPNLYQKLSHFYLNCCFVCVKDEQKQRANSCTKKPEYRDTETGESEKMSLAGDLFYGYRKLITGVHIANTRIAIKC